MALVAAFDGYELAFEQGSFDEWCIYVTHDTHRFAPTDEWYFTEMTTWSRPVEHIYDDFVSIYNRTTAEVDPAVLALIAEIADGYAEQAPQARLVFTILYMGMIAEENKAGAILKKRIKRLGVYQILLEGLTPKVAANYSRGMKADYLDKVCYYRGF